MSNPPFPKAAEPVRQKIRELVERPKELPKSVPWQGSLGSRLRWKGTEFCPVYMLPRPLNLTNEVLDGTPSFFDWWDSCEGAQDAVDTVWGKK